MPSIEVLDFVQRSPKNIRADFEPAAVQAFLEMFPVLDLSAVYKHRIFQSDQRSETHALVANELSDHQLRWHGDAIDTQLYKFNTPRLSLYSLRYGASVSIFPETYRDFSLIHFALRGGISVEADGARQNLHPGRAIISSPSKTINLQWSDACEQIILRMPDAVLVDAAAELRQPQLYRKVKDVSGLMLSEQASHQWQAQLQAFMALDDYARESPVYAPWLSHMESCIAMFLLLQGSDATRHVPDGNDQRIGARQAKARLERFHAHVDAHLTAPVTLAELARAAALSERQLNTLCHEHLGMSPMAWLRVQRLEAVRRTLRAKPHADIAATAMLYGFFNLGRFASYYRSHFGELPSQTVKFAKSG